MTPLNNLPGPEPRLQGSRFGDVIWTRIVRGGLARIELRRIPPGWARTARAGVDSGDCVSRPRPGPRARHLTREIVT